MPFDGLTHNLERKYHVLAALQGARNRLATPGGWIQGVSLRDDSACSLGAIVLETSGKDDECFSLRREAERYLASALPFEHTQGKWREMAIIAYNDRCDRTQEEIVIVFDEAIKILQTELNQLNRSVL